MNETMPPEDDVFDPIAYARERGVTDAKAGPGFTPPYNVGDPRRRAWLEGYNGTPKGVPGMSGKSDVNNDEQRERSTPVGVTLPPLAQVPRITRDEIVLALYLQFLAVLFKEDGVGSWTPHNFAVSANKAAGAADALLAELNKK